MLRGTNLPAVSAYNQVLVLDLIRRSTGLSRVELADRTGLSAQTLSNVTRRLIAEGFVREAGRVGVGPGKPRTLLELDPTAGYGVGVHVDPSVLTTVVLDLSGRVIEHRRTEVEPSIAPGEAIEVLAGSVAGALAAAAVPIDRVNGIGLAAPGPLDAEHGRMFSPPLLDRWHDVAIGAELSRATGLEVVVEKDVTAAVIAETWMNEARRVGNAMFFYYGTGVGAGLTLGGDVLRGASSNAGEVGHLIVDPDGPMCRCGRRGCLGDGVAPRAILDEAAASGLRGVDRADVGADLARGWQRFADALHEGDQGAWQAAEVLARRIARAVAIVGSMLDLDAVVFGGPYWDAIADLLLARVSALVVGDPGLTITHPLELTTSSLGPDVVAVGAGCIVLDRTYSARPNDLLIDN